MGRQAVGERIPISLFTGFLGSGKTTLIASLLKQPAMAGTAVVVNEFGAVGIDDAILAQSNDDVLLLANGCLCCTAGDDLATTVWSLARRRERPRRIAIETTGLAEPGPVLRRLMGDPRLALSTRLDTIVATIDAVSGIDNLDRQPVAGRQCAISDRRVITKGDLTGAAAVDALRERLVGLNPGAEVLEVSQGEIAADELLGASLFDSSAGAADLDHWLNAAAYRGCTDEDDHGHDHRHAERGVATWLIEEERPVDWNAFCGRLGPIVAKRGDVMLRVKGVVHVVDDPRPVVIHGVQRTFHPPVRLHGWTSAPRTRIVVIGESDAERAVKEIAEALEKASLAPGRHRDRLIA